MDEFNDLLSKHELTEEQLTLCRDIRRRGKNKVSKILCSAHTTCKYLNTNLKSRFMQLIVKRINLGGCPKLQKTKDRPNQTTGRRCWKNPKSKGRISSGTWTVNVTKESLDWYGEAFTWPCPQGTISISLDLISILRCKIRRIFEIEVEYNCHNQYILGAWTRSKPMAASNGSQSSGSYFTTKSITRNGPS